jgi:hypothetical protein
MTNKEDSSMENSKREIIQKVTPLQDIKTLSMTSQILKSKKSKKIHKILYNN